MIEKYVWRSSFFSKFAGLQAYSQQVYYKMNSITDIFDSILNSPMLPPCFDLSPPIKFWGGPPSSQHLGETLGCLVTRLACFKAPGVLQVKIVENAVITIR